MNVTSPLETLRTQAHETTPMGLIDLPPAPEMHVPEIGIPNKVARPVAMIGATLVAGIGSAQLADRSEASLTIGLNAIQPKVSLLYYGPPSNRVQLESPGQSCETSFFNAYVSEAPRLSDVVPPMLSTGVDLAVQAREKNLNYNPNNNLNYACAGGLTNFVQADVYRNEFINPDGFEPEMTVTVNPNPVKNQATSTFTKAERVLGGGNYEAMSCTPTDLGGLTCSLAGLAPANGRLIRFGYTSQKPAANQEFDISVAASGDVNPSNDSDRTKTSVHPKFVPFSKGPSIKRVSYKKTKPSAYCGYVGVKYIPKVGNNLYEATATFMPMNLVSYKKNKPQNQKITEVDQKGHVTKIRVCRSDKNSYVRVMFGARNTAFGHDRLYKIHPRTKALLPFSGTIPQSVFRGK